MQRNRSPLEVFFIIIFFIGLMVLIVLIVLGYIFNWDWVGIGPKAPPFHGKTLWDWLQLLVIPLVLAVAALLFNRATTRAEQKIALDKQREDLLQAYLDRMSDLLLKEKLRSSAVDDEVRNVAQVRTITILFQLDARRIGYVFAFLRESGLMTTKSNESIVSFIKADLRNINFSRADLIYANLSGADLKDANLSRVSLFGANLSRANLKYAHLTNANLSKADLTLADLTGAIVMAANLSGANLEETNLSGTFLTSADLTEAILLKTTLGGADLAKADLTDAKNYTTKQLDKAQSLKGATMPDGSTHP